MDEDIQFSVLKEERKAGLIIGVSFVLIALVFIWGAYMAGTNTLIMAISYSAISAAIGFTAVVLINRKIYKDLREKKYYKTTVRVEEKETREDVEPGSGVLYIPILADLFPKLWGAKMNKTNRFYVLYDSGEVEIDETLYSRLKKGDSIEQFFASYSKLPLGIRKVEQA